MGCLIVSRVCVLAAGSLARKKWFVENYAVQKGKFGVKSYEKRKNY
jgi:hypothetical protein